jgi:predicted transport protein
MNYVPSKVISLKKSAEHSEKSVQQAIANNPEILGLGEITLRETERRQLNGGRLDLLFDDEASKTRYTVELQLGQTDETHIIRTIEYWDNERSRNPHIDHIAVIVAEDITTRFLNVISLFNKSIPLIAIQLSAIQVGKDVTLNFVKVLDLSTSMGWEEDNTSAAPTDRPYWLKKATPQTVGLADKVLGMVHEIMGSEELELNYNKHYIGLASGGVANNFITMKPRKQNLLLQIKLPRTEEVTELIEQSLELISYDTRWGLYQVRVTQNDLADSSSLLRDLMRRAAGLKDSSQPED